MNERERYESPALPKIRQQLNRKLADCENSREQAQMMVNHLLDYIAGMEPRANGKINSALQRVEFLEAENRRMQTLLGRVASASVSQDTAAELDTVLNEVLEFVGSFEKVDEHEWTDAFQEKLEEFFGQ